MASRIRELLSRKKEEIIPAKPKSGSIGFSLAGLRDNTVGPVTYPKLGETQAVEPETLETVYMADEIVQGIINKYVVAIIGSGMYVESDDEKTEAVLTDFLSNTYLKEELREIIRNIFVYGTAYVEKVYNRGKTKIVKLPSIDPRKIDFERNESSGEIILDNVTKEPKGFKYEAWMSRGGRKEIKLPRKKVAIFKFFSLPGDWKGYSPLEGLVQVVTYRKNVDRGIGEVGYRTAFPGYVLYIGDKDKYPSPPQTAIDAGAAELTAIGTKTVFAFPWYYKLSAIEVEGAKELASFSDHFINAICSALMFPKALITVPERAAGGVLSAQLVEWEKTVEGLEASLSFQISQQILDEVCELENCSKDYELKFRIISPVTERDRARTVASMVRSGAIIPGPALDNYLRKQYDIPLETDEFYKVAGASQINNASIRKIMEQILEEKEEAKEEE